MSSRIAAARAKLTSRTKPERGLGTKDASIQAELLPPLDHELIEAGFSDVADPFADGADVSFGLIGGRELGSPGKGTAEPSSPAAVGRLWASFAKSDVATASLGHLSGSQ